MSDCQEEVDEKNMQRQLMQLRQWHVLQQSITVEERGLWFLTFLNESSIIISIYLSIATILWHWPSIQNQHKYCSTAQQMFGSDGDTHLGSLQHLPFVENLHSEHLISVFQFYDCDLQKGKDKLEC